MADEQEPSDYIVTIRQIGWHSGSATRRVRFAATDLSVRAMFATELERLGGPVAKVPDGTASIRKPIEIGTVVQAGIAAGTDRVTGHRILLLSIDVPDLVDLAELPGAIAYVKRP